MTQLRSRGIGAILTGTLVCAGIAVVPLTLTFPQEANAQEELIAHARVATEDMAVTEKTLEQVTAPEGYTNTSVAQTAEVASEQGQVRPLGDAQAAQRSEEISLARALVSSPSVVFGVTFPLNNADENVTVTYRERHGQTWSEWKPMVLAEISEAPIPGGTYTMGTEPLALVDVQEIEVSVVNADQQSIPGVRLTVIEPELTADELEETRLDVHGEEAVADSESVIAEKPVPAAHKDQPVEEEAQPAATSQTDRSATVSLPSEGAPAASGTEDAETPAEQAEEKAEVPVPGRGGMGESLTSAPQTFRMQGPSADGKAYVTSVPGLTITTRKGWGADESVMDWDPEKITFKGAVVHHTAGTNNYTKAQVPGIVRGVYRYHAVSLGWGDVGYHLLVDKFGGVWEGRAGGLTNSVEGGHAHGANRATFGISVLGDYMHLRPTDETIDAVAKAIAWKFKVHGIKDLNATFRVPGKQWGKTSIMLPVVSAHRHVGGTDCPGDAFMTKWDELQTKVRQYSEITNNVAPSTPQVAPKPAPSVPKRTPRWGVGGQIGTGWNVGNPLAAGAFSGKGRTDAMLVDAEGRMWLYPGIDNGRFPYSRRLIGTGWNMMDQINAGVDFDGDGVTDIVARERSNGDLRLYPGDGRGSFKSARRIGVGWNMFSQVHVVADMADGNPLVYGVEHSGKLRSYLTDGRGNFTSGRQMGGGWSVMRDFLTVGDKTGDGLNDLVVIDDEGRMWLYTGLNGFLGGRTLIGHGWSGFNPVLSSGDDGNLWTVDSRGRMYRYIFLGME